MEVHIRVCIVCMASNLIVLKKHSKDRGGGCWVGLLLFVRVFRGEVFLFGGRSGVGGGGRVGFFLGVAAVGGGVCFFVLLDFPLEETPSLSKAK